MRIAHPDQWEAFLNDHPGAHLLQTSQWGKLKTDFGWQAAHFIHGRVGAQVLIRRLPLGLSMAYIPRGPVGDPEDWTSIWPEIDQYCRDQRAIFLKVEPNIWTSDEPASLTGPHAGFYESCHSIQPRRTLLLDISVPESEILARMKQKTRYNIRLAQRKGVSIHPGTDLEIFQQLMLETAERDAFGVHSQSYYQRAFQLFRQHDQCELLFASYAGEILAALMVFAYNHTAWYFYGASSSQHREMMPTYLLQWEAILWAKSRGCSRYDLWGVPDEREAVLESEFTSRNDGLWGVYRFKRGFGGQLVQFAGPWDRPYQPSLYRLYSWWMRYKTAQDR